MTYEWVQGRYFRGSLVERKNNIRLIVVPKYSSEQGGEVWEWCCETQGLADTEDAAQKAAERAADAYRRGAEAMREATATAVRTVWSVSPDFIRALPIPEDKP